MTDQELKEQAAVMLAYANAPEDKKPKVELRVRDVVSDPWEPCQRPGWHPCFLYRLAPSPIAPGHNPDKLTVEQVGEGWRLLSVEEQKARCGTGKNLIGTDYWDGCVWHQDNIGWPAENYSTLRTKNPPGFYLTKKVRKPCGPEHFPPGTVVRGVNWPEHCSSDVVSRAQESIGIVVGGNCSVSTMRYENMLPGHLDDHMRRSLDGGKTWLPCYVEEEEVIK